MSERNANKKKLQKQQKLRIIIDELIKNVIAINLDFIFLLFIIV
jgi:hypothetical protein